MKSNKVFNNKGLKTVAAIAKRSSSHKNVVAFFMKNCEKSFLTIENFPINEYIFPRVGELITLDSYSDEFRCELDFDMYHVRQIIHNLGNVHNGERSYIEVVVDGLYYNNDNNCNNN